MPAKPAFGFRKLRVFSDAMPRIHPLIVHELRLVQETYMSQLSRSGNGGPTKNRLCLSPTEDSMSLMSSGCRLANFGTPRYSLARSVFDVVLSGDRYCNYLGEPVEL